METDIYINPDWYRTQLGKGKLMIVQCIVSGDADGIHDETLHWILLYGYEGESFFACDPLSGKIKLSETELEEYTHTPVGAICVAVSDSVLQGIAPPLKGAKNTKER